MINGFDFIFKYILPRYKKENGEKMNKDNTNWSQSVAGVVIRDNKVLLARHTYGNGK